MDMKGEDPENMAAPLAISTRRLPPIKPRHSGSVCKSTYLRSKPHRSTIMQLLQDNKDVPVAIAIALLL